MGKNRHSKDKLFITQTEHKYLYGGKKQEIKRAYKRLPFNCCAITLSPFKNPVCTREGHVFDLEAIVSYLENYKLNPITGKPLSLKELIKLKFHKNAQGAYYCPVTYKEFTNNSKLAAIATTGNVFLHEAIEKLNIKTKNWFDLLTSEPFKRKDIIILQDPENLSTREIENFEHLRNAQLQKEQRNENVSNTKPSIRTNAATDRILQELEAARDRKKELVSKIQRGDKDVSEKERIQVALTHVNQPTKEDIESNGSSGIGLQYSRFTKGECAQSFTSSSIAPVTKNSIAIASQDEILEARWRKVRQMKKKGLVRLHTTLGDLNLEIHCDIVPQTADNFLSLCSEGYYDNTEFHRLIPGFMIQGGDPTGTGRGGESIWKKSFRDEIDSRLSHQERGIISMANSGPNTNKSQFFITFGSCTHLDKKHSIFGRVVGGKSVLDVMEGMKTDKTDHPIDKIIIDHVEIFTNPFKHIENENDDAKSQESSSMDNAKVVNIGGDWVTSDTITDADLSILLENQAKKRSSIQDDSVGKYLKHVNDNDNTKKKKRRDDQVSIPQAIESKKVKKSTTAGFGQFSGW